MLPEQLEDRGVGRHSKLFHNRLHDDSMQPWQYGYVDFVIDAFDIFYHSLPYQFHVAEGRVH